MSFPVKCPGCETKLKAQEKHVGKKLTCPKCKHPFVVQAPEPEVVEVIADLPTESTPDPLMDADLGNMDFSDFGSVDAFAGGGDTFGAASYAGLGVGDIPAASAYAQPATRPAAPSKAKAAKGKLSPQTIAIIAAGGVGGMLLLIAVVALGVWALRPSKNAAQPETAQANPAPPVAASAASTDVVAPAQVSSAPPKSPLQLFLESQTALGTKPYASLSRSEDGKLSISAAATGKDKFAPGPPRNDLFPDATGLPLASRPKEWFNGTPFLNVMIYESASRQSPGVVPVMRWHAEKPADANLIQSKLDGDGYTLARFGPVGSPSSERLREIEKSGNRMLRSDHHHLWSQDGSSLYVLAGLERPSDRDKWTNRLLKINTQSWTIELTATAQLPSYGGQRGRDVSWSNQRANIRDLAWSSEGLVAIVDGPVEWILETDAEGAVWVPMTPELSQTPSLVILDPVTLDVKRAWAMPTLAELGASPNGPLVYLTSHGRFTCVINVQSGELVSVVQRNSSMLMPHVTADGKWLLSYGENAVNRFRLEGDAVVFDQSRAGVGKRGVIVSSDGHFVSFHGRDKYYAVRTEDLDESVGTATGGAFGQIALDSVNKTVYVCSVDPSDGMLGLQVNRQENPLKLELDSVSGETNGNKPKTSNRQNKFARTELREDIWPLGMSAEPTGRGVIIFVEDATYWFESRN